jgi:lysophospholipase L1-like esterase
MIVAVLGMAWMSVACRADEPLVKAGDTIAFLGDSITAQGIASPNGYVNLVKTGLEQSGIKVNVIGAGVGGNKSNQMLARLDADVLAKKPTWLTISCGVNDVWHGTGGVKLEDYKKNITEIVDKAQAADVKVMILTATPIYEDLTNAFNKSLQGYNEFLRDFAKERKLPLADLDAACRAALNDPLAQAAKGKFLTVDGVHMNARGNTVMAYPILQAFGLSDPQLKKVRETWGNMTQPVATKATLTQNQYDALFRLAVAKKMSVQDLIDAETTKAIEKFATEAAKDAKATEKRGD